MRGHRAEGGHRPGSTRAAVAAFLSGRGARPRTGEHTSESEQVALPVKAAPIPNTLTQPMLRADERPAEVGGRDRDPEPGVEIFVNLARRMQWLVHREIELLDEIQGKVEDPELLKGLFEVDHLATRLRRQAESLAVLAGSSSRRQWSRPVTMQEVLRAAAAEVEQYSRVTVVPPTDGVLRSVAVADVIHLVAELVENAAKFSAPETTALVRAQYVRGGVVIEIEDRGLGMPPADQARMNELLAGPGEVSLDEVLRGGRIGLYVVAVLARRHGIRVRLQNNIYGGTQAVVMLPKSLFDPEQVPASAAEPAVAPDRTQVPDRAPTSPGPVLSAWQPTSGASSWATAGSAAPDLVARPALPKRQVMASAPPHERERNDSDNDDAAASSTEPDFPDDHPKR